MRAGKGFVEAVALGVALGAISSLTNALDGRTARFGSYLANSGWVWAAVAVAAGRRLKTRGRGAVAGTLALLATTTAYYVLDSALRQESFASHWYEMRVWWGASLMLGSVLGVVGASTWRPGLTGFLARLVVPVGAAAEMVWLPRWSDALGSNPVPESLRIGVRPRAHRARVGLVSGASVPPLIRVEIAKFRSSRAKHDRSLPRQTSSCPRRVRCSLKAEPRSGGAGGAASSVEHVLQAHRAMNSPTRSWKASQDELHLVDAHLPLTMRANPIHPSGSAAEMPASVTRAKVLRPCTLLNPSQPATGPVTMAANSRRWERPREHPPPRTWPGRRRELSTPSAARPSSIAPRGCLARRPRGNPLSARRPRGSRPAAAIHRALLLAHRLPRRQRSTRGSTKGCARDILTPRALVAGRRSVLCERTCNCGTWAGRGHTPMRHVGALRPTRDRLSPALPDPPAGAGIALEHRQQSIPASGEGEAVLHGVGRSQFAL